jgi:hypothetical protein
LSNQTKINQFNQQPTKHKLKNNMKLKKIILAAAFSLGVVSLAGAATTVYVTGSTAFRAAFYNAIKTSGVVFTAAPTNTLYGGGGSGANYMEFEGTLIGGGDTIVECHWSGSEGGMLDVASNTVVKEQFIDPSLFDGTDHGSTNPPTLTSPVSVDLAMVDNLQKYSLTRAPLVNTNKQVGIIPFVWVRNPGLFTGSNVSDNQIRVALGGGAKLAAFSGNAGDTNSFVYVEGRDNSSGTRDNAYGDTGYGIYTQSKQIEIDGTGTMQDINADGTYYGNFGFSSGGLLRATLGTVTTNKTDLTLNNQTFDGVGNFLSNTIPNNGFSIIAYLGRSDANTAIGLGATELSYNGVPYSLANIEEGTYTFWGNEYIYAANSDSGNAVVQSVYNKLAAGIPGTLDNVAGIPLTSMHSKRNSGPVADPIHN